MIVGLTSPDDSLDQNDLSDYAFSQIQYSLARVPGVGEVEMFGAGMRCGSGWTRTNSRITA